MKDRIFAKWLYFNPKHEKAPDWVIGWIAINVKNLQELVEQVKEYANDKWYARFQITQGKEGKYSISVDTYARDREESAINQVAEAKSLSIDDIPF